MENTVLGNALEGVPESEGEEKPESQNIESANNLDGLYSTLVLMLQNVLTGACLKIQKSKFEVFLY